jgi:predicted dehydrogenase
VNPLEVGLIGLGNVVEAHLRAYESVRQFEVVAGAEPQEERLRQMAQAWGFTGYTSDAEMLAKEQLDIAWVLTPTASHREIAECVVEHGFQAGCGGWTASR